VQRSTRRYTATRPPRGRLTKVILISQSRGLWEAGLERFEVEGVVANVIDEEDQFVFAHAFSIITY
jgi:hypothetical protein